MTISETEKEVIMLETTTRNEVPVRLFKSDALEFFTHISPVTVAVVWIPIVGIFLTLSIMESSAWGVFWHIAPAFLAGVFLWTFWEYTIHRFIFHYHPKSEFGKRINFLFHGNHHLQPMVKTRLVMPPMVSVPLGVFFYSLYFLIFDLLFGLDFWPKPMFAGTALGYLMYDLTHYATHHFRMKSGYLMQVRSHHMKHHAVSPDKRFGVTSRLWDFVFGTEPKEETKA